MSDAVDKLAEHKAAILAARMNEAAHDTTQDSVQELLASGVRLMPFSRALIAAQEALVSMPLLPSVIDLPDEGKLVAINVWCAAYFAWQDALPAALAQIRALTEGEREG